MFHFCTYFDQHYLSRGLALYRSLRERCPDFQLWVLCMDSTAYRILKELRLPSVHPIGLEEFERDDEPLRIAKTNRSRIEYYFTCTPCLPLYLLNKQPEIDLITYLDADLFFFASPAPLFEEMGKGSIAIIAHRFPPNSSSAEVVGTYNVGFLSFRRDRNGLACLQWWRQRCIEWCYDRKENGRFGDQKYLDDWPTAFQGVVVLQHKGANLGSWNVRNYRLSYDGQSVFVDDQPLICVHFDSLRRPKKWLYVLVWTARDLHSLCVLRRGIVLPYLRNLQETASLKLCQAGGTGGGIRTHPTRPGADLPGLSVVDFRTLVDIAKYLLRGRYYLSVFGRLI